MQACGSRRRNKGWQLAGGRCGQCPGERQPTIGEEVVRWHDIAVQQQQTASDGVAVVQKRTPIKTQKRMINVGQEGYNRVLGITMDHNTREVTDQGWNTNHLIIQTHHTVRWPDNT